MKPSMRPDHKIRAAAGPLHFRIVLGATVCVMGFILLFVDLRLGVPILGGGLLGLMGSLWARKNRDSPWVHGLEDSNSIHRPNPRMDQALEYKRLLDSGLISEHDYQIAMKKLFPHLPVRDSGDP